jgi:hypothetical protein
MLGYTGAGQSRQCGLQELFGESLKPRRVRVPDSEVERGGAERIPNISPGESAGALRTVKSGSVYRAVDTHLQGHLELWLDDTIAVPFPSPRVGFG